MKYKSWCVYYAVFLFVVLTQMSFSAWAGTGSTVNQSHLQSTLNHRFFDRSFASRLQDDDPFRAYRPIKGLIDEGLKTKSKSDVKCENNPELQKLVARYLDDTLLDYKIVKLDGKGLFRKLASGKKIKIPLMDVYGEVRHLVTQADPYSAIARHLRNVNLKGKNPLKGQLPVISSFKIGCEALRGDTGCGMITFLDKNKTLFEGIIADEQFGVTVIESAQSLLANASGGMYTDVGRGCSIAYNSADHMGIEFLDMEDEDLKDGIYGHTDENSDSAGEEASDASHGETSDAASDGAASDEAGDADADSDEASDADEMFVAEIPIHLDSDATFYSSNSATVWTRQTSIINVVNLIYSFIEPISAGKFDITFPIVSMESWLPGYGPTTTNKDDLSDEINDEDYWMISHPANNEVSYFYVGYDMNSGIAGEAGSVCNLAGYDDGIGSNEAHQDNHAWGQQVADSTGYAFSTFWGRSVVAAHEIGHLVGGTHADGSTNQCAGGLLSNYCGSTLMKSGAAGGAAPDDRVLFFSNANDDNIVDCVDDVY